MPWNRTETKSLQTTEKKVFHVGAGAPVSINPSTTGRAYADGWNIERAYREGMQRVTWVARCLDVIAGNAARLPVMLRKGNHPNGEIMETTDTDVLRLLNSRANVGENSFAFRYRMSTQLLMSSRGVFIEKEVSRSTGKLIGISLLPPQFTYPIPDRKTFVAGYEVRLPNGDIVTLPPDKVVWIRKPHPLDPYLSLTPLESAGVAIEIENLAKQYNMNFLQFDGRPGMMLVARGELDIDDRQELEGRFNGGPLRAGRTTVIGAEGGIDVIDMSASPRDASYTEMRNITKDEILTAFGVSETALGNAGGRTFNNASEDMRTFWLEAMIPHLHLLARGLDELDPKNYVDFDTRDVPIMVLLKQERERFFQDEFEKGLISANEYRILTGKKPTKSDLADSLLANPNLTPIANTEKEFQPEPPPEETAPVEEPASPPVETPVVETPTEPAPDIQAALRVAKLQVKDNLVPLFDVTA
jgi:HK97 family phage portal protein